MGKLLLFGLMERESAFFIKELNSWKWGSFQLSKKGVCAHIRIPRAPAERVWCFTLQATGRQGQSWPNPGL